MINSQTIAVKAFTMHILTSFLVDEILQPNKSYETESGGSMMKLMKLKLQSL